jgi:hypothetical protein
VHIIIIIIIIIIKVFQSSSIFEISTWYCPLTATSLSFLRLNKSLQSKLKRRSFTYWQSLPDFRNHQIMVSITGRSSKRSDIISVWIPSFIYHYVIDLVVCFPTRRSRSVLWTLRCRNIVILTISVLISCKLSFPIVDVKIYSLPVFYWNLVIKYPGTTSEIDGIQALVTCKPTFRINNFILTWCTHMQHTNELLVLDMT